MYGQPVVSQWHVCYFIAMVLFYHGSNFSHIWLNIFSDPIHIKYKDHSLHHSVDIEMCTVFYLQFEVFGSNKPLKLNQIHWWIFTVNWLGSFYKKHLKLAPIRDPSIIMYIIIYLMINKSCHDRRNNHPFIHLSVSNTSCNNVIFLCCKRDFWVL